MSLLVDDPQAEVYLDAYYDDRAVKRDEIRFQVRINPGPGRETRWKVVLGQSVRTVPLCASVVTGPTDNPPVTVTPEENPHVTSITGTARYDAAVVCTLRRPPASRTTARDEVRLALLGVGQVPLPREPMVGIGGDPWRAPAKFEASAWVTVEERHGRRFDVVTPSGYTDDGRTMHWRDGLRVGPPTIAITSTSRDGGDDIALVVAGALLGVAASMWVPSVLSARATRADSTSS